MTTAFQPPFQTSFQGLCPTLKTFVTSFAGHIAAEAAR